MRCFLIILLVSFGTLAFSQKQKAQDFYSQDPAQSILFLNGYDDFKGYVIMLDGKMIERNLLTDYPGIWLDKVFNNYHQIATHWYPGALYFKTAVHPPPLPKDTNAYFINGRQVTFQDIERSRLEAFTRIGKSEKDTIIDGVSYKGTIRVETTEDFFASNIPVLDFLGKYPCLSPDHTYIYLDHVGIIHNNRHLYHVNPQHLLPVKAGYIRLAEGMWNVVHLVDTSWSNGKAWFIFENSSRIDIDYPCYLKDFDLEGKSVSTNVELPPVPFYGTDSYLQRLSEILKLPEGSETPSPTDSIDFEFVVTQAGMLTDLHSTSPAGPGDKQILFAIKRRSCDWSPAIIGGRPRLYKQKMTIFYTVDRNGNVLSLNSLKFQYDS